MEQLERRVGKFSISRELLLSNPEVVLKIMAHCIIVRCECMYVNDLFDYLAVSPEFDIIETGEIPPYYNVTVEQETEDSDVIIKFEREK